MRLIYWIVILSLISYAYAEETTLEEPNNLTDETNQDPDARLMLIRSARYIKYDQKKIIAEGGLRFRYKGYDILADYAEGNTESDQYVLEGNVFAKSKDKSITADKLTIDFKTKAMRFFKGQAELNPDYLQGNFIDDLYIKALSGGGTKKEFEGEYCESTTCRAHHPHYQLNSRNINVIPNKRAILKDVDLWLLNTRLIHLPVLVIPLDKRPYNYFPECGYNSEKGYYIKTNIGFPIDNYLFILKTDYFSKIGFGIGGEYQYEGEGIKGKLSGYSLLPDKSVRGGINHKQDVGKGTFETDITFTRNDRYVLPRGWRYRTNTRYSVPFAKGSFALNYIRNQEKSQWGKDLEEVADLQLDQQLTNQVKTNIETNYNKREDNYQSQRFLDVKFKVDTKLNPLDINFLYQRKIPIKVGPYYRGITTNRTPFVECITHTDRLFGSSQMNKGLAYFFPLELKTSHGQFFDIKNSKTFSLYRSGLALRTGKSYEKGATKVDWQGKYDQQVYSDKTAQYILNLNSSYRYKLGSDTAADFRYNYTHPYGYTPLSIDRVSKVNRLTTNLGVRVLPQILLNVHTGRDFLYEKDRNKKLLRSPWLPLRLGAIWTPSDLFKFEVNSLYDSNLKKWTGQTLLATWEISGGQVAAGARYDSIRKQWSSLGFYAKSVQVGNTSLGGLVRYNGYTKKLTETQLKVVYNLHCMEAAVHVGKRFTGYRTGIEYGVYLYLKASPCNVPDRISEYGEARSLLDYYD